MEAYLRDLQAALAASEQMYRKVERHVRSTTTKRQDLLRASELIRDITGGLYRIHLALSVEEDADFGTVDESFDLDYIHSYQQLVRGIDVRFEEWPGDLEHTVVLNDLANILSRLSLALSADGTLAALRALSKAKIPTLQGQSDMEVHLPLRLPSDYSETAYKVRCTPDPAAVARWSDARLNFYLRLRSPGSLLRTMENPLIQEWLGGQIHQLWLHGERGSGKTVLASTMVEWLITEAAHDPTTAVCYHIFEPKPWGTGASVLLAGLAGQLARQNEQAYVALKCAFSPERVPDTFKLPKWILDTLQEGASHKGAHYIGHVLNLLQRCYKKVFFVIDGPDMDETTSRDALAMLRKYRRKGTSMLVLSREPSDEVGAARLRRADFQILDVTPGPSQIKGYIEDRLQKYARNDQAFSLNCEEVHRIAEVISSKTRLYVPHQC